MTRDTEHIVVRGDAPLPGRAAGRTIVFTWVSDLAGAFWLSLVVGLATFLGHVLLRSTPIAEAFLALAGLSWLYLLARFVSPFKVQVGLETVTEWRWYGRRTSPMREAYASSRGRRYCSLLKRRSEALADGLDPALLKASEWLVDTSDGRDYRNNQDAAFLDGHAGAPMAILAVADDVVPIVDNAVWLDWKVGGGTHWRLAAERLRAASECAAIVLVPRTWNDKYLYFAYSEQPLLLAPASADVEAIWARLQALS